eukprot:5377167-Amphidinium_carterae.2
MMLVTRQRAADCAVPPPLLPARLGDCLDKVVMYSARSMDPTSSRLLECFTVYIHAALFKCGPVTYPMQSLGTSATSRMQHEWLRHKRLATGFNICSACDAHIV